MAPMWLLPDDAIEDMINQGEFEVDEIKLQTLTKRRAIYGDLCQEATPLQLKYLLLLHDNNIPMVLKAIKNWTLDKGTQKYIPPAFYDRDGSFIQPPSFEIPVTRNISPKSSLENLVETQTSDNTVEM